MTQPVYLALGTNLGDRWRNLTAAVERLGAQVVLTRCSSVYETEPAYVTEQPRFLNMVCGGQTNLRPHALLHFVKELEAELGRQPSVRYGPRLIDIDILLYGDAALHTPDLVIPHPRLAERAFVLIPLAEIAPTLTPPGSAQTITTLAAQIATEDAIVHNHGPLRLHDVSAP